MEKIVNDMKRLSVCLTTLVILCSCTDREQVSLYINVGWEFSSSDGRKAVVDLPHDAMLEAPRSADAPGGTAEAFFQGGTYTYTKTLDIPKSWLDKHVTLDFDGVYRNTEVFVNDKPAGGCEYGYLPFSISLDDLLKVGSNVIRVEVDNSAHPSSRWYPGGGIYRPVKLTVSPARHIESVRVKTVSIHPAVVEVEVESDPGNLTVEIIDGDQVVCRGTPGRLEIPSAKLWSAETPNLYRVRVRLESGDVKEVSFGVRQLQWSPEGFFVNGENVLLKGGCLHHDNGIAGAADLEESAYRRVALLKQYGFNAIRSAHNPASENLLKACDELGMYVMDELWDMWFHAKTDADYSSRFMDNYREDIAALIRRDFNHPSVVMYSIGNEVAEPAMECGMDVAGDIIDRIHQLDDTRPVTAGINLMILQTTAQGMDIISGEGMSEDTQGEASTFSALFAGEKVEMTSTMYNMIVSMVGDGMSGPALLSPSVDKVTSPILDALDIAGYNYGKGRYAAEGTAHPHRIVVGSETMPYDIAQNWAMVEEYPYLIGDFMWTAWDYLGEVGIGAWGYSPDLMTFSKPYPWLLADTGALDILGNPNGEAFWAKATWTGNLSMAVQPLEDGDLVKASWRGTNAIPSWSWPGCEGKEAVVEVYCKADKVTLALNGEFLSEQPVEQNRAVFSIPYSPGKLVAEAFRDGKSIGTTTLQSAEGGANIRLRAEPKHSEDKVYYFDIALVGDNGELWCKRDQELSIRIDGGELIGFGSARPSTEDRFGSGYYATYYGRAQAIVKASSRKVTVTVSGEGLTPARTSVTIK